MVQQVTQGIKISVKTEFDGTFYKNRKIQYAFAYNVTIENQSKDTVQLTSRHWKIKDALNVTEIVEGEGVIGQKPILHPGEKHMYTSGCLLLSPFGAMKGYYNMVNYATTRRFRVSIPLFKLSAPFSMN
ncbi:Co2+/Mg2+ efflux protein ApaG [Aequorivita sp. F47161]|jgi:ApaG protein|uniref:Co2+/Mg2+ efflux protein ApaG n=1 Tax=Aequorivita vitellina TaxID=2874475 RepID=A0A9X1U0X6_9FLAO|nr:Co2+/Mg2+ efflux protein ApaG [Aequorivita vitellina]MCG2418190.1 Co2+/Mg2+ efflux protein ApaG [Aequorivita vitellina]